MGELDEKCISQWLQNQVSDVKRRNVVQFFFFFNCVHRFFDTVKARLPNSKKKKERVSEIRQNKKRDIKHFSFIAFSFLRVFDKQATVGREGGGRVGEKKKVPSLYSLQKAKGEKKKSSHREVKIKKKKTKKKKRRKKKKNQPF